METQTEKALSPGKARTNGAFKSLIEGEEDFATLFEQSHQSKAFREGEIVQGRVVALTKDTVVVDVGAKSEGEVDLDQFRDPDTGEQIQLTVGDVIDVLVEVAENDFGVIQLSKEKADRLKIWDEISMACELDELVEGVIVGRVKGGLSVDIGVKAFLPGSQIDIRPVRNLESYVGEKFAFKVIKFNRKRGNIVLSRRALLEKERESLKKHTLDHLEEGAELVGTVKNITEYGAFVDLGGIDGLLHITDMSWGRVNHPSEVVRIGQEMEVKILNIDREKEKIALGLKQLEASPWEEIEGKYPIGCRVKGSVVNLMTYGAFVRIEEGIEGLVHISEMSWTRRINHPSECVQVGDEVEVVVLDIDKEKLEISLGMKQTEVNPWELVAEKYPPGTIIEGKVRNLANYGAFIEIEPGIDGLLHVSDISWTKKVAHPNEIFQKGEVVKCVVIEVDQEKQRVGLGLKQLSEDPWIEAIPTAYRPGMIVKGKVTKITNFGVFVELEDNLEGLLHISELSDQKIENPQDVVKVDDEVDVKILRVDIDDRKIGLSLKRAQWGANDTTDYSADIGADGFENPSPKRGGMDDHGAMGTDKIQF